MPLGYPGAQKGRGFPHWTSGDPSTCSYLKIIPLVVVHTESSKQFRITENHQRFGICDAIRNCLPGSFFHLDVIKLTEVAEPLDHLGGDAAAELQTRGPVKSDTGQEALATKAFHPCKVRLWGGPGSRPMGASFCCTQENCMAAQELPAWEKDQERSESSSPAARSCRMN